MKYTICFFILFNLFFYGQQTNIDSLIIKDKNTSDYKTKVEINLKISKLFQNKNRDSSKVFAQNAINNALQIKDNLLLSKAYLQMAKLFYKQSKDKEALNYLNKIDSIYNIDKKIIEQFIMSKVYRSEISKFTFTMKGVKQAKTYLLEALKIAKKINNEKYINLIEYRLGGWHGFMSQAESPKQHLDTANQYMDRALKYYKKQKDHKFLAKVYYTKASIAMSLKKYKEAEKYYKIRLNEIKKIGGSVKTGEAYYGLGSFYRRLKQLNKGLKYLDSASYLFKKYGFSTDGRRKNLYRDYAYLYEQKKDYKNAFLYMQKAIVLKDTLYEERNKKMAMELEAKYQNQKKQHQIALLNRQKKNERNMLLGGLTLIGLTSLFLFFAYRNNRKTTQKLKELDLAKTRFITNISHEFKTPLTLISGIVQGFLKKKSISNEDKQNFEIIDKNSDRLLELINQLLAVAKLENCVVELQKTYFSPAKIISVLCDSFIYIAKEKNITFKQNLVCKQQVFMDREVLVKIVSNLLSNAFKYTPENGEVNCRLTCQNQNLQIEVKNTGEGLNKEEIKKIFSKFYQKDNNAPGVGIGLSLVKNLVALHGGKINVKSQPGKQTTFRIEIPFEKTKEIDDKEICAEIIPDNLINKTKNEILTAEKTDKPVILIVEDNPEVANLIASVFQDDFVTVKASNGQEGIEQAVKILPHLIISDIMMPVTDGIELCRTLKNDKRTAHIPIILLTAKSGEENKIAGIKTGADDYITKPFNIEILKEKVKNLIKLKQRIRDFYRKYDALNVKNATIKGIEEGFLNRVEDVLKEQLTQTDFNVENFAKAIGVSRMQLHRRIKEITGMTTSEFIRIQRLKLAAFLLQQSDADIVQIAYTVGFNSPSYFNKCFKEMYQCTPKEYIQLNKK